MADEGRTQISDHKSWIGTGVYSNARRDRVHIQQLHGQLGAAGTACREEHAQEVPRPIPMVCGYIRQSLKLSTPKKPKKCDRDSIRAYSIHAEL